MADSDPGSARRFDRIVTPARREAKVKLRPATRIRVSLTGSVQALTVTMIEIEQQQTTYRRCIHEEGPAIAADMGRHRILDRAEAQQ
ncbi:hypothetical protein JCM16408A_06090 [Methylobacterium phyllosphaerae]